MRWGLCRFALTDHLAGDIVFGPLEAPILLVQLSLHRVETVDDEDLETTLFQEDLLDVRKGGAGNMPIPCASACMRRLHTPVSAFVPSPRFVPIASVCV